MVSYDDDVDAAMKVHLLKTVHQLTDDVVDLSQRVIQLQTGQAGGIPCGSESGRCLQAAGPAQTPPRSEASLAVNSSA